MSIYDFQGYLAQPRTSLGAELIGFNARTGQPVQASAGVGGGEDGLGSYLDLSTDYYKTFQHDNWQHPGSDGWSSANVPGWGENPNLQMFPRRGVGDVAVASSRSSLIFLALLGIAFYAVVKDKIR